jgi:RimJ/RimL family protein N-acetyltransferase
VKPSKAIRQDSVGGIGGSVGVYLKTARLILRQFTPKDVENLWELDSDPEVTRHLTGGQSTPYEVIRNEEIPYFLTFYREHCGLGWWAAELKETGEFIGWFHLKPDLLDSEALEIGYRLKRTAWSNGYATEVVTDLVRKAFEELGASRVTAYTRPENEASLRVMQKAGLRYARTFVSDSPGRWRHGRETVEYALSKREFEFGGPNLPEAQGT